MLARRRFFTPELSRLQTTEALLSSFDVDHIEPEALLWQAGYLTIHHVEQRRLGHFMYTLGYPNAEVECALNEALVPQLGPPARPAAMARQHLEDALRDGDMNAVEGAIRALFASIPHDWYRNNPLGGYEGHYASVFYSHLAALGLDTRVEDATNHGRIDLSMRIGDRVYLFEFKVVDKDPEGKALAQLQGRAYAEKYRAPGVTVTLVGIEFGKEARNVVGFEVGTG
ncbi:MAG: PD-(D/E)XK nuclease domain-containing protein, partial [Myxococcota bacterium]